MTASHCKVFTHGTFNGAANEQQTTTRRKQNFHEVFESITCATPSKKPLALKLQNLFLRLFTPDVFSFEKYDARNLDVRGAIETSLSI